MAMNVVVFFSMLGLVQSLSQVNQCCHNGCSPSNGGGIGDIKSEFVTLQDKVVTLHGEVITLQGKVVTLQSEVQALRTSQIQDCSIELNAFGYNDAGFSRSSSLIRIGGAVKPLDAFPREPSTAPTLRGIFLVTLGNVTLGCEVTRSVMYDTYSSKAAATALDNYLRSLNPGTVVAGICVDECLRKLGPTKATLYGMGIAIQGIGNNDHDVWRRTGTAFIAWKAQPVRTLLVQHPHRKGPAILTYIIQD